jgi:hypothetical protein
MFIREPYYTLHIISKYEMNLKILKIKAMLNRLYILILRKSKV